MTDRGYVSAQLLRPLLVNEHTRTVILDLLVTNDRTSRSDLNGILDNIGMVEGEKVREIFSRLAGSPTCARACVAPVSLFDSSESSALHRLFLCSNSLQEGLQYLERFSLLIMETMETWVSTSAAGDVQVNIRLGHEEENPLHRRMTLELVVSQLLNWFHHLAGDSLGVRRVTLPVPEAEPEHREHYHSSWGVPVEHDDGHCVIHLEGQELDQNLHKNHPLVQEFMRAEVESQLLKQVRAGSLSNHIYQALMSDELGLDAGQQDVAAYYRISARTLNRHLQQEATTLKQLVTQVRIERAKVLLEDSSLGIDDVARRLGLSGRRTLDRIFMKYEQQSPAQYRQQLPKASSEAE